jgi:hypothetical protein
MIYENTDIGSKLEDTNNAKSCQLGEYVLEWKRVSNDGEQDQDNSDEQKNRSVHKKQDDEKFFTSSIINLPLVSVEFFPLYIETSLPTHGNLNEHFTLVYKLNNKLKSQVLDLECSLDENEYFSIAGNRLELIQIMPNDATNFTFSLYPLQVGYCKLPKLSIKFNNLNLKSASDSQNQNITAPPQPSNQASVPTIAFSTNTNTVTPNLTNDMANNIDTVINNMLPSQIFIMPSRFDSVSVS